VTITPHHKILLLLVISTFLLPAWVQGKDVPERIDIDERYKWDLSDMYRDTQAWELDREKFIAVLPTLERFRGQLSTDGPTLLAAIEAMQSVETIIANLYVDAGKLDTIGRLGANLYSTSRDRFALDRPDGR